MMEICLCFQMVGAQATAGLTYKNTNKIFLLIGSVLERRRSVTCGLASVIGSFAMPAPSTIGRDGNGLPRFDLMCKAFNPVLESIPIVGNAQSFSCITRPREGRTNDDVQWMEGQTFVLTKNSSEFDRTLFMTCGGR
ncbi:hypothetical protein [Mesorhizobium sp. URHB0026]